jgi:hypothetical protein
MVSAFEPTFESGLGSPLHKVKSQTAKVQRLVLPSFVLREQLPAILSSLSSKNPLDKDRIAA